MRLTSSRAYTRVTPVPKMPPGLVELMEGLARDVLKHNPTNVYEFSANHMQKLIVIRDGTSPEKLLTLDEKISIIQEKMRQKAKERREKFDREVNFQNENNEGGDAASDKVDSPINREKCVVPLLKAPVHHIHNLEHESEFEISHVAVAHSDYSEISDAIQMQDSTVKTIVEITSEKPADVVDMRLKPNDDKLEVEKFFGQKEENDVYSDSLNDLEIIQIQDQENVELPTIKEGFDEQPVTANNIILPAITINSANSTPDELVNDIEIVNIVAEITSDADAGISEKSEELPIKSKEATGDENKAIVIDEANDVSDTIQKNCNSISSALVTETEERDDDNDTVEVVETAEVPIDLTVTETKHMTKNELDKSTVNQEHKSDNNIGVGSESAEKVALNQGISDTPTSLVKVTNIVSTSVEANSPVITKSITPTRDLVNIQTESINMPNTLTIPNNITILSVDTSSETLPSNNDTNKVASLNDVPNIKSSDDVLNVTIQSPDVNTTPLAVVTNIVSPSAEVPFRSNSSPIIANIDIMHGDLNTEQKLKEITSIEEQDQQSYSIHPATVTEKDNTDIAPTSTEIDFESKTREHNEDSRNIKADIISASADVVKIDSNGNQEKTETDDGIMDSAFEKSNTDIMFPHSDSTDNTNDDSMSIIESDLSKTDDDSLPISNNVDLETAAVTIQKVFRSFMFKSRNSEDTPNDEHNSIDEDNDKKEEYYAAAANLNKDRRPLGITRMDTVLQTVNEEKSLSLSTDDSSTLSSAATTIQAHVRGFLVRNKLNSSKTFSMNSLVNSHEVFEADSEQHKNKTVLNIHIVPEEGNYLSRDESLITSMDLSLDSPPSSVNLHPLSYDTSERRKMLKREDAVQSVTPPSNNSGKLSEESVKELSITENGALERAPTDEKINEVEDQPKDFDNEVSDVVSSASTVTPTTVITISKSEELLKSPREYTETALIRNGRSFTKMSSDESDVVTPFIPSPRSSESTPRLIHSGEFHEMVLPTKVTRNDTSVVREFKNVLVYFLLWNNS